MKVIANKHRREVEFQIVDLVLAKFHPYCQLSMTFILHNKLCQVFRPIQSERKDKQCRLQICVTWRQSNPWLLPCLQAKGFHWSSAIHNLNTSTNHYKEWPILYPVAFLDCRTNYRQGKRVLQSLVQWSRSLLEDSSWEDDAKIRWLFPSVHHDGKANPWGGGHVMEAIIANFAGVAKLMNPRETELDVGKLVQSTDVELGQQYNCLRDSSTRLKKPSVWVTDWRSLPSARLKLVKN